MTEFQAQFFRGLGRGVCEGCGHLRKHCDLQCARCRVATPAREIQEGEVVTAASLGIRDGDARGGSDMLEHVAGAGGGVCGDLRGGHHVRASVDGVSDVGMSVGRQRRRACPVLPRDLVARCEALGSSTLVHVPNPARDELIPMSERGAGAFAELRLVEGSQGEDALGSQGSRVGDEDSALKGISFEAMSAPGPSGARHEHLRIFFADQAQVCGESAFARVGDLLGACAGRRLAGRGTQGSAHFPLQAWV